MERRYSTEVVERIIHAAERLHCVLNFMLSDNSGQSYLKWLATRPDISASEDADGINVASDGKGAAANPER